MNNYIVNHMPWQLLLLAIFIQSSIGNMNIIDFGFSFQDKFFHFIVFGILAILMARSFKKSKLNFFNKYYHVLAILLTGIYGVIDEYHQYFVPGRFSTVGDWLADLLGAIVFIIVFYYWERWNYLKA
ncbi:MAG: VanZ family protein [Calditrichia bacterium]|nr:VanZ family protein [Calditrichia bacterium]